MKHYTFFVAVLLFSGLYTISSCTDKLAAPTIDCTSIDTIAYVEHIKPMLDASCNVSGCHDGGLVDPFESYSTLSSARLNDIYNRICVSQNMPPTGSGYSLSSDQVDSVRCWDANGYVESLVPTPYVPLNCSANTITYNGHVAGIFGRSCNTAGCHDNTNEVTLTFNNLDSARRELVVFIAQQGTHPAGNILHEAEMDSIRCWKAGGYLQN